MAKVERLVSGKFRIRWIDPWGKRTSKVFATAADARDHYRNIQGDIARGTYTDPRRQRTTVAEWADVWLLGARHLTRGGHDIYRRDLDRHILPRLGALPLVQLDAKAIDRYLTEIARNEERPPAGGGAVGPTVGTIGGVQGAQRPPDGRPAKGLAHSPGTSETGSATSSGALNRRGLSPSTVHRHYRTLHRMLAIAVKRELLPRNPCDLPPRRQCQ
jgi:hypothetical protein